MSFIEIVIYTLTVLVIAFGVIPAMLFMWGSLLSRGVFTSYFELLNKYKNGKKKKE